MNCDKCGGPLGTFHVNGSRMGESETFRYCEDCFVSTFGQQDVVREMKQKAKAHQEPLLRAELEKDRTQVKKAFGAKIEELCAVEPRFSGEAYEFIFMTVSYKSREETIFNRKCGQNLSAREFVAACEDYAQFAFGSNARSQLHSWGLARAEDIGGLVFFLIENQMMGKKPEDQRSDFDGLPFLEEQTGFDSDAATRIVQP